MTATPKPIVRVLRGAAQIDPLSLSDWGPIAPLPGAAATSRARGVLLHKGPGGSPETGVWECTPGQWACRVERDEFCCFLAGRSIYTDASGERTSIGPGDIAFFPAGWIGTCRVIETVRKAYMIR